MNEVSSAAQLAQALVRIDTTPDGDESDAARLLFDRLGRLDLEVRLQHIAPRHANVMVTLPGTDRDAESLLLSGHLDTVGRGESAWDRDPFGGDIIEGRLHGRGAADMKGGVAAMVVAFERLAAKRRAAPGRRPVTLALTAKEETGCQGAEALLEIIPGPVGAILIGEATSNRIATGHKGVMWATLSTTGVSAHASTPELGRNAIVPIAKAVTSIAALSSMQLGGSSTLGRATLATTTIRGGIARNVIPDGCTCSVDVRLTENFLEPAARRLLRDVIEDDVDIAVDLTLPPVLTPSDDPWIAHVSAATGGRTPRLTMNYFTDAAVLARGLGHPPVCLMGPGDANRAHQVDEWCGVDAIDTAMHAYLSIIDQWCD